MTLPSGIDLTELDPGVRPQDDLFRHVNGRWIDRTEIPSDKARYGSFIRLAEAAEDAVRAIVTEAQQAEPGTEARKFGDLFTSFMDETRIEQLGSEPIRPMLAAIDEIASTDDLLRELARLERGGSSGFFHLFVDNDPGDPERYLVMIQQGGIGLPDEAYYREEQYDEIRAAYRAFIERMFALAEVPDAAARAARVFDLETRIAAAHWDKVRSRDSEATYNLTPWGDVPPVFGPWLDSLGTPAAAFDEVVVRQPSFLAGLADLIEGIGTDASQLESWRDWSRWQVIRSAAPYLSSAFVEANFDFYGRTLSGTPEMRVRWKRGVSLVEGVMGEAVGRVYVERHFDGTAKSAMDELVGNLVEAYRQSISTLEWMTEETRARALEKLEKFTPKVGYPVKWRDYSSLQIDAGDLIGNVRAAGEFEFQRELAKIGRPIDRDEWFMTPQTVNAYYNPGFNEIVFPAAILQFPFFEAGRDAAANYGAIGAVIGHEIGHGFDDQGSKFDGDGRLLDWWTEDDRAAFEERTASLIAQYDALSPRQIPGHTVNGALTIGENIGDLGGLGIAWKAYLLSLGGQEPPKIDGLSGAQRFLLSWAQAWQFKLRDEEALRLLAIDPHSPAEFRCNQIVRNLDVYYDAFEVTEADELWLAESERVTIW